jgi:putative endonuclease
MPRRRRPSSRGAGARAEDRAAARLRHEGYRIVDRNFRCRLGELDIVAEDGDTLVFVEVRSRASARYGSALQAISPAKRRQVARVAQVYLAARRCAQPCRFDVVGITGDDVVLIKDAFRLGLLA